MAAPKRGPGPESPDLSTQSDFQLLNGFTSLVSKEHSQPLKEIAWEIMRRYSSYLDKPIPSKAKNHNSILGDARWGDARRVEAIFGIKRGVLIRLREAGLIRSKPLEEDHKDDGSSSSVRAKRLYSLISIAEYLESGK
jgi:hypothetical protein